MNDAKSTQQPSKKQKHIGHEEKRRASTTPKRAKDTMAVIANMRYRTMQGDGSCLQHSVSRAFKEANVGKWNPDQVRDKFEGVVGRPIAI